MRVGALEWSTSTARQHVPPSGAVTAQAMICDALRAEGVEVVSFAPEGPLAEKLAAMDGVGRLLAFRELARRADQLNECDVVLTSNWLGAVIPELSRPLAVVFHSNMALTQAVVAAIAPGEAGVVEKWLGRLGIADHATDWERHCQNAITISTERHAYREASAVIAVSEFLRGTLIELYGARRGPSWVIRNTYRRRWLDREWRDKVPGSIAAVTSAPGDRFGFVAKGLDRLLEFVSTVGLPVQVVASGAASWPSALPSVGEVVLERNASHERVAEVFASSAVSAHVSRSEACQLTLIEAMLMGAVPVTFRVGVAAELIDHGREGFLVDTTQEMTDTIRDVAGRSRTLRAMAVAARRRVLRELPRTCTLGPRWLEILRSIAHAEH